MELAALKGSHKTQHELANERASDLLLFLPFAAFRRPEFGGVAAWHWY